jgi:hypothetical protein
MSHHGRDRLYFSSESIMSTGFNRQFANLSIRALNHHDVAAVIATSSGISPVLGAAFLSTLDDTLNAQPSVSMSLELAMFDTLQALATKEPSKTSGQYDPSVLAYALLGNENL